MYDLFKTIKNNKVHFWYTGQKKCTICDESFNRNTAYCVYNWNKKKSCRNIICYECVNKKRIPLNTYAQDRFIIYCIDEPPISSIPVFPQPPNLKVCKGDISVFEGNKVDSDKTSDKCVYANSFFDDSKNHGFIIGKQDNNLLSYKDKNISVDKVLLLIDKIKKEV